MDTNPPVMFLTQPRRERLNFDGDCFALEIKPQSDRKRFKETERDIAGPLYDTPFFMAYRNLEDPTYTLESMRLLVEPRGLG